jgi:hypothetical protein
LTNAVATAEIWFTYQGSEGGSSGEAKVSATRRGFKYQLLVALGLYVGLFFVEYPPIFLMGYWSWGAVVHKTITGVLLILNLLVTQYSVKRIGLFRAVQKVDDAPASQRVPGA